MCAIPSSVLGTIIIVLWSLRGSGGPSLCARGQLINGVDPYDYNMKFVLFI
jgi:hypothetical protein